MTSGINKLVNTFASLNKDTVPSISYGTVTSTSPLSITQEIAEERVPITEGFLVLSKTCKATSAWEALAVGEKVILLSFNGDQKFFVERI